MRIIFALISGGFIQGASCLTLSYILPGYNQTRGQTPCEKMIHWHSLLTQRSPQQGAFPGKTSGPLFVDATLLIQPAAWFRKHHGKAGQNLPGTCERCWPAIRRSRRVWHFQHLLYYRTKTWMQKQTENVFLSINLCNPLTHREGKECSADLATQCIHSRHCRSGFLL